jgi:hypothetical protein
MKYVGIDLHKQTIVLCVVNKDRKILDRQRFRCADVKRIKDYFGQLGSFQFVVEATATYEWLVQLLEPLAQSWVLAHPGKMRLIAESAKKTDELDARDDSAGLPSEGSSAGTPRAGASSRGMPPAGQQAEVPDSTPGGELQCRLP